MHKMRCSAQSISPYHNPKRNSLNQRELSPVMTTTDAGELPPVMTTTDARLLSPAMTTTDARELPPVMTTTDARPSLNATETGKGGFHVSRWSYRTLY